MITIEPQFYTRDYSGYVKMGMNGAVPQVLADAQLPLVNAPIYSRMIFQTMADGTLIHARLLTNTPNFDPKTGHTIAFISGITRRMQDNLDAAHGLLNSRRKIGVLLIDTRGCGVSSIAEKSSHYTILHEAWDYFTILTKQDFKNVVLVGSSRGGIVSQLLACVIPNRIRGIMLNDVGCKIEERGIMRIRSSSETQKIFLNMDDALNFTRTSYKKIFPEFRDNHYVKLFNYSFRIAADGRFEPCYDMNIAKAFSAQTGMKKAPNLTTLFKAVRFPHFAVVRGELSDFLSARTVARMQRLHPNLQVIDVPHQGHTPFLGSKKMVRILRKFSKQAFKMPAMSAVQYYTKFGAHIAKFIWEYGLYMTIGRQTILPTKWLQLIKVLSARMLKRVSTS